MPKNIVVKGSPATCGHPATGSSKVFSESKGVTRVGDRAGALIIGPGSSTVFVEGRKASLVGDSIVCHARKNRHKAKTRSVAPTVYAGK